MKKSTMIGVLTIGLMLNYSCEQKPKEEQGETVDAANEKNDTTLVAEDSKEDAEFIVKAANGGLLEVEAATIAQQNGTNKEVKEFAKQMLEDHSKANTELKQYASRNNIAIPDSLDVDSKEKLDKLKTKQGKEFDKDYIDFMVSDHKEDVELFEEASKDAKDPELKAWVDKTLPVLRHHLGMAQQKDSILDLKGNKN